MCALPYTSTLRVEVIIAVFIGEEETVVTIKRGQHDAIESVPYVEQEPSSVEDVDNK